VSHQAGDGAGHRRPEPVAPWHGKYKPPASWKNPAVGARNLMVSRDQLNTVARSLRGMADQLQTELNHWQPRAAPAGNPAAAGRWEAAAQLSSAVARTHAAVSRFATDLAETHNEVAAVLTRSADHYDEAERATAAAIRQAASGTSATLVQSGGMNQPVHERHHHAGADIWNGTEKITADSPFRPGSVAHHSWQQINKMIQRTDPDAITNAGDAYQSLYEQLTAIASQLSSHGENLAEGWAGQAAVNAVSQVQMMHQTAAGLQAVAWRASQVLTWFGPVLRQFQAHLPHPATVPPPRMDPDTSAYEARAASQAHTALAAANLSAATRAAQQRLVQLNEHIEIAYNAMPAEVKKNLPAGPQSPGAPGGRPTGVQHGPPAGPTLASFSGPGLTQPGGPGTAGAGGTAPADSATAGSAGSAGMGGQAGAASGDGLYGGFPMGGGYGAAGSSQDGAGRARDSWDREDRQTWEPSGGRGVIGDGSGIGADGMIGTDAVSGDPEPGEADEPGAGWDDDGPDIPPLFG
jgi:uncharacterized protein YukE